MSAAPARSTAPRARTTRLQHSPCRWSVQNQASVKILIAGTGSLVGNQSANGRVTGTAVDPVEVALP